jgi:hypothetical protein
MGIPNYENEINEILGEEEETYSLQQDQSWAIRDINTAVWADNLIPEKELTIAQKTKIADDQIAALEAKVAKFKEWKINSTKKEVSDIEFFKSHLHAFHMRQIAEEESINEALVAAGKKAKKITKTIKLPFRDLTCKAQQPEILINGKEIAKAKDEEVFVNFVKSNNPEFIKEEVKWGDYKKTLTLREDKGKLIYTDEAGQTVDFITLIKRGDLYDWKIGSSEEE